MKKILMLLCIWLTACGSAHERDPELAAQAIFPLRTQSSTGKSYQLRGTLEILDFMSGRLSTIQLDSANETLLIELGPDRNEVRLLDGWVLEELNTMNPMPVSASLVSDNPMTVFGTPGIVTYIPIRFLLGGEVLLSTQSAAAAQVRVEVTERQPLNSLCVEGDVCLGGITPVGPNYAVPAVNYNPRELPFGLTFNIESEQQEPNGLHIIANSGQLRFGTNTTAQWTPYELATLNEIGMTIQNRSFDVYVGRVDNRTYFSVNAIPQNDLPGFNLNARLATTPGQGGSVLSDASGVVEYMSLCGATTCLNPQPDKLGPVVLDVR